MEQRQCPAHDRIAQASQPAGFFDGQAFDIATHRLEKEHFGHLGHDAIGPRLGNRLLIGGELKRAAHPFRRGPLAQIQGQDLRQGGGKRVCDL